MALQARQRGRKRPIGRARTLLLAALTMALTAGALTACRPTGVKVTQEVGGFDRPWDVQFTPEQVGIVTERPGRLSATAFGVRWDLGRVDDVFVGGEAGLMGLAVDPDFTANRHIYTCYTSAPRGASNAVDVRIVRWTVAADYRSLGGKTPILTGIPAGDVGAAGNRHVGCRIAFGPDGMLWASTGDAVIPTAPQDPASLAGKVLRLTRNGAPAPGNPGGGWNPYVFTIGHRNPQGLAFRASDGWAFVVEHGTGCDDEVNLLVAGGNYGWNPVVAGGGYNENASMTSPGGRPPAWSSGCPTTAPSGGTFLSHPGWGEWQGSLVVANLKAQQLTRMPTQGGAVTGVQKVLDGYGRLRATTIGPGGALWVLTDASPGRLLRVQPAF